MHHKTIHWLDPLDVANAVDQDHSHWVLLYSGINFVDTGRYSFIAYGLKNRFTSDNLHNAAHILSEDNSCFDNIWFGFLGYGLKNSLEDLPQDEAGMIDLPNLCLLHFGTVLRFDHVRKCVDVYADDPDSFSSLATDSTLLSPKVVISNISSNMTKATYLESVADIKAAIVRGDLYQANLTRKFFGEIHYDNPFSMFCRLCDISPAPFSAYIKNGNDYIISSSPERFLKINADGNVETRPIKGTAARYDDPVKDKAAKHSLLFSEKDRSENLMIVDLSRNDLSRSCNVGSVSVDDLFHVDSYATVHHMVSTIRGIKSENVSSLEFISSCFPPGSMTGTPKIKAMELCSALEKQRRGIYAGAIGWFGGDGSVDLSVVIRTLLLQGNCFEFQVGGAIVHDSVPLKEWEETLVKARGIAHLLGISLDDLATL